MKDSASILPTAPVLLHILIADDDMDDLYFFGKALEAIPIPTTLATVEDGEALMTYLHAHSENLPDVLFLDLNMPRKNGSECLTEIKQNEKLKLLTVVILSTSMHEQLADRLYREGANYYIQKTNITDLTKKLRIVFSLMQENKLSRPSRQEFTLNAVLKY